MKIVRRNPVRLRRLFHLTAWCRLYCCSALLLAAFSVGCAQRVSVEEESQASSATFQYLRSRYRLITDPELAAFLHRVTGRLALGMSGPSAKRAISALDGTGREIGASDWRVFVIDAPTPNAFSLGSGVVVLTRGMLLTVASESELAAVLSHEFSHQLLGHTLDELQAARAVDERTADANGIPKAAFSLDQEIAADSLGVQLLFYGGYDVTQAISALSIAFDRLGRTPTSNHPASSRPGAPKVSSVEDHEIPDWLTARTANVLAQIQRFPAAAAPGTSREFNRMQKSLAS